VTIDKTAPVRLTTDQLQRVALATDQAEAQGATRALVLIDGQALRLDVLDRRITGSADLSAAGVLTGLDAVVSVPGVGQTGAAPVGPSVLPLPRSGIVSPSLLRALSGPGEPG
jgi:hypothetical protein